MAAILLQQQVQLSLPVLLTVFAVSLAGVLLYAFLSLDKRYRHRVVNGLFINLLVASMGGLLVWVGDVRHDRQWFGHAYSTSSGIVLRLQEPLVEKANSYKAVATVEAINDGNSLRETKGKVILYLKKDSAVSALRYGARIVTTQPLQEIRNTGNPGSFDYKQYCLFAGITHQVWLTGDDYTITGIEQGRFYRIIYSSRERIIAILQRFIPGEREQGLAEALLIGYKDDLDKQLVQAYSNTGVVHVIAISGLHLALVYALLLFITAPLKGRKALAVPRLVVILAALWLFSLLAGGQPSVMRSAVMFSFIAAGEVLSRRTNIYNSLALSAFVLLCVNPFWLWDVGFQLSYAAVLSIVVFFKPVYHWLYLENKSLDFLWKLSAVSIAAQVLTLPLSIYHFHQAPLLFLLTNVVAVPLSSVILIGEIILCGLAPIGPVAKVLGTVLYHAISFMNSYIERLDTVSFAVWSGLSITLLQAVLLTGFIVALCTGLLQKQRWWTGGSTLCLSGVLAIRAISFLEAERQQRLVVYNVPKHQAIEAIAGRKAAFIGDEAVAYDEALSRRYLQPTRILYRTEPLMTTHLKTFAFCGKQVLIIDTTFHLLPSTSKPSVDVLILSHNPKVYMDGLFKALSIRQVVIDGSVPFWKAKRWKRDCDSLRIPCHDVSEKGAFVLNL